jgi:hypothetical protein
MKITGNTIVLVIGILLILLAIWFSRPRKSDQSDEYRKIDSVMRVIEQRQLRDSLRQLKADSILNVVAGNNKAITKFANELSKINKQLGQTLTDISNLNANELVKFYSNQLPQTNNK